MNDIHERMPVILPKELEKKYLSDIELEEVLAMLKPYDAKDMEAYPISTLINSPANDIKEVINRI